MTRTVTLAGYALLAAALLVLEVAARRRHTATFADFVAALTRTRPGKGLVLVAWLWLGWHLFVRADR